MRSAVDAREEIRALEDVGARVWVAPDAEELDGWLLRFAHGLTGRANSVLPSATGRLPLDEKIERVERWYAERKTHARFQLTDASLPPELEATLTARGYVAPQAPVGVWTASLPETAPDARVELRPDPSGGWLEAWTGGRGFDDLPTAFALVTGSGGRTVFARVGEEAIGRGVALDGWLGITSMATVHAARRRGLGRAIVSSLLAWGRGQGCTRAFLQVEAGNDPARRLYESFGFRERYAYRYRVAP